MEKLLAGKVAVVTGASQGIGRAIALGYAHAGAKVCCAARNSEALDSVVKSIHDGGGQALAVVADVTKEAQVEALFSQTASALGGLDIVVVNAGVHLDKHSVEASDSEAWKTTIEVNLFGAYYCIKHAIPALKQRRAGKIITIGSGLGHRGRPKGSAYACSKAALWMLTQVVAQELATENISINELIPGPVETGMISPSFRTQVVEGQHEWLKDPEDVVPLALFLATQPDWGPSAQSFSLMRRAS
jgi:3-oxoacyl-[acyl-carrier protein] reductase